MPDRKKVIKGLECCMSEQICKGCPYKEKDECENGGYYYSKAIEDALVLLKEQEPILLENQHKPCGISTNANSPWISRCPKCGKKVEGKQTRFCKYCGQAVKWND